jgi:hypothetical protein
VQGLLTVNINVRTYLLVIIGPLSFINQSRYTATAITVMPEVDIGTSASFRSFTRTWQNQAPNNPLVKAWISTSQPKLGNRGICWVTDTNLLEDSLLKNINAFLQKHLD